MNVLILVYETDNIIFIHKQRQRVEIFAISNFSFTLKVVTFGGKHTFASVVKFDLKLRF